MITVLGILDVTAFGVGIVVMEAVKVVLIEHVESMMGCVAILTEGDLEAGEVYLGLGEVYLGVGEVYPDLRVGAFLQGLRTG